MPDGWSTEPVEVDEAYGIKTVSFFSPSTELGIMVHYIAGASSADYVGQEEVNAKAAADALGYSYYWISDTSGWSTLSDYDAYNYFIIISEDEYAETSFCYDSYVIDADGGAYVVQIVRVTGTDSEYTEEYDNAMSDAYMSAVCFQLP